MSYDVSVIRFIKHRLLKSTAQHKKINGYEDEKATFLSNLSVKSELYAGGFTPRYLNRYPAYIIGEDVFEKIYF